MTVTNASLQYQPYRIVSGTVAGLGAIGGVGAAIGLETGKFFIKEMADILTRVAPYTHTAKWVKNVPAEISTITAITGVASLGLGLAAWVLLRGRIHQSKADLPTNFTTERPVQKHWSLNALLIIAGIGVSIAVAPTLISHNVTKVKAGMIAAIIVPVVTLSFKVIQLKGKWLAESLPFSASNWSEMIKKDRGIMTTALVFGLNIGLAISTIMNAHIDRSVSGFKDDYILRQISIYHVAIMAVTTTISCVSTMAMLSRSINSIEKVKAA